MSRKQKRNAPPKQVTMFKIDRVEQTISRHGLTYRLVRAIVDKADRSKITAVYERS